MKKPFIGTKECERGWQQVKNREFCLGHVKLGMPIQISKFVSKLGSQPGGGIYIGLWFWAGIEAGDMNSWPSA